MAALQAKYAPSSYVGLWFRRLGMERSDLDAALEDRSVIQGTLLRITIHLASRADYWLFAAGLRAARRQMWLRLMRGQRSDDEMQVLADRTRTILSGGSMKRAELIKQLGVDSATWVGVGLWVDLVSWSGLPVSMLAPRLEAMETVSFRNTSGKELFDLPGGLLPDPATPVPVRFLPTWDASLLVHCRRAGILPEQYRPLVFHVKNPQSVNTFPGRRRRCGHLAERQRTGSGGPFRAAGPGGPAGGRR